MTPYELQSVLMVAGIFSAVCLMAEAILWVTDPDRNLPANRRKYQDGGK